MSCQYCNYHCYPQPMTTLYLQNLSNDFIAWLNASQYSYNLNLAANLPRAAEICEIVSRRRSNPAVAAADPITLADCCGKSIPALAAQQPTCKKCLFEIYDNWFATLTASILLVAPPGWNLGHAQKFANVFLKYHFVYFHSGVDPAWNLANPWIATFTCCFHAPLDSIVLRSLHKYATGNSLAHAWIHDAAHPYIVRAWTQWPNTPQGWDEYMQAQDFIRNMARTRVQVWTAEPDPKCCCAASPQGCSYPHNGAGIACVSGHGIDRTRNDSPVEPRTSSEKSNCPCPGALAQEMDGLWQ